MTRPTAEAGDYSPAPSGPACAALSRSMASSMARLIKPFTDVPMASAWACTVSFLPLGTRTFLTNGSEDIDEMPNATEYLLKAILEIIDKSETVEEIREAVKKILEGK